LTDDGARRLTVNEVLRAKTASAHKESKNCFVLSQVKAPKLAQYNSGWDVEPELRVAAKRV
jgi:hypothetical protein